jgi:hypothetical protein
MPLSFPFDFDCLETLLLALSFIIQWDFDRDGDTGLLINDFA